MTIRTLHLIALAVVVAAPGAAFAKGGSHSVKGHTTKNGTYVQPHHATNRDSTKSNNYSHKGNVNPYTGKTGTKD
jgi:hypothetical protein